MCFIRNVLTRSEWLTATLLACVLVAPARADYRYQYAGNPFTVANWTANAYVDPDTGIPIYEFANYDSESSVTAVLYTHSLLTVGSGLGDVFRFTLTRNDGVIQDVLEFPYPYFGPIDPLAEPGSPGNPYNNGFLSIGAVDAAGLPTDWNIAITFAVSYPTGRQLTLNLVTSTTVDSVSGGYEGFSSYSGASNGTPGQWSVSVVSEPATPSMLIAGSALLWARARRRSSGDLHGLSGR